MAFYSGKLAGFLRMYLVIGDHSVVLFRKGCLLFLGEDET